MENIYQNETDNLLPLPLNGRVSFISEIKMPDIIGNQLDINIKNFAFRIDILKKFFSSNRNQRWAFFGVI